MHLLRWLNHHILHPCMSMLSFWLIHHCHQYVLCCLISCSCIEINYITYHGTSTEFSRVATKITRIHKTIPSRKWRAVCSFCLLYHRTAMLTACIHTLFHFWSYCWPIIWPKKLQEVIKSSLRYHPNIS